jgi:AcrR family transcriptional regulator/DNA-binding MarR family transcriptional regulator
MVTTAVAGGRVLGPDGVSELQRARALAAITELVAERGVAPLTVAHIVERSRVSRRTFYEFFEDRDDCLRVAFERAIERAAAVVRPAYEAAAEDAGANENGVWEAQIRAGLGELLGFLDAEPALGRLLIVDALAADRRVLERRAQVVELLIDAVHEGGARRRGGRGRRPARIVAEGAVGAVLAVIHTRMCEANQKPLAGLLGRLMGMIVLPYRGAEAAEREVRQRAPRARPRPAAVPDPLRALDMRLTYRTLRVMLGIAELSGLGSAPSSREVAEAAGVTDQGQISKLLSRLEQLGLIANGSRQRGRGASNAWSLTPKGEEVQRAIRAQTGGGRHVSSRV